MKKTAASLKPMQHLSIRVAWHDDRWNGTVCRAPSQNSFCVGLDRIRAERDEVLEDQIKGKAWADLTKREMPPCMAESGGFMNTKPWTRVVVHPYQDLDKTRSSHGHLKPTTSRVPEYCTFAVPFAWMLRANQDSKNDSIAEQLPPDVTPP